MEYSNQSLGARQFISKRNKLRATQAGEDKTETDGLAALFEAEEPSSDSCRWPSHSGFCGDPTHKWTSENGDHGVTALQAPAGGPGLSQRKVCLSDGRRATAVAWIGGKSQAEEGIGQAERVQED